MAQSNDSLHKQSVITGRVTDGQGNAVSNATIRLASGDSTRSDNKGEFRIGSQAGVQLLQIRKIGFGAVARKVEVSAGDSLSLEVALSRPVRYPGGDCAIVVVWTARYRGAHH